MEDGGVDTTVIDSRQHKMGQMADFPPLLASSISKFCKYDTQMAYTLMQFYNSRRPVL